VHSRKVIGGSAILYISTMLDRTTEAAVTGKTEFADDIESLKYAVKRQNLEVDEVLLAADVHVVLNGLRLHYLDWGNQGKRPILFLHGGGLNAHTYDLVCLALRGDYHCLALDQRGHGDSEWSPVMDYDMRTHAADIEALVGYLGLERFILVGQSMGGVNAIQYAGQYPDRPAAMVAIDIGPETMITGGQRIRDFMNEPTERESLDDFVSHALAFNPRRDPRLLRRSLQHNLRRTPEGKFVWKWDPRPRRAGFNASRWEDRRSRLWAQVDQIKCPTLVVRGAESDVLSEENATAFTNRLRDGHYAVVESAGHTIQGDNPSGLVREMRAFLSSRGL